MADSVSYKDAGVNIDEANAMVKQITDIVEQTSIKGVLGGIGGFGALFQPDLSGIAEPVLVSSTDGVGTKLKIAFMLDKHDSVGIDLVAMSVNDLLVQGAKPLFFLDYIATGKVDKDKLTEVVKGVAAGCRQARCALIGGETAEMSGFYVEGEYDLAGFCVGLIDKAKIIDGAKVRAGDVVIGIASSGLHSNGYSLVRKICFERLGLTVNDYVPELGKTLGAELITPTTIYTDVVMGLMAELDIHAIANITGGGLPENTIRTLPAEYTINIRKGSWDIPPVFGFLQKGGNVPEDDLYRTLNMGIGMTMVVAPEDAARALDKIAALGCKAYLIGEISAFDGNRFSWSA